MRVKWTFFPPTYFCVGLRAARIFHLQTDNKAPTPNNIPPYHHFEAVATQVFPIPTPPTNRQEGHKSVHVAERCERSIASLLGGGDESEYQASCGRDRPKNAPTTAYPAGIRSLSHRHLSPVPASKQARLFLSTGSRRTWCAMPARKYQNRFHRKHQQEQQQQRGRMHHPGQIPDAFH